MSSALVFRPTWRAYLLKLVAATLVVALIVGALTLYRSYITSVKYGEYFYLVVVFACAVFLLYEYLDPLARIRSHVYFVGEGKAEERVGILGKKVKSISVAQVREIVAEQGVVGRLLGYGSLRVISGLGSSEDIHMEGIRDPMKVKEFLEAMSRRYPEGQEQRAQSSDNEGADKGAESAPRRPKPNADRNQSSHS